MRRLLISLLIALLAPAFPAHAGENALVMIHSPGCGACARWDREIAPIYEKTDEASRFPLRRLDILTARQGTAFALTAPPYFTPTFILIRDGQEIGRIIGYSNDFSFWGLFDIEKRKLASLSSPNN